MSETSMMWFDMILQTCLDLAKTKRWRNTQKFEWMTDKVADDDDYYKVIPWITSSKSSDQKLFARNLGMQFRFI